MPGAEEMQLRPSSPKSATLRGIIVASSDTQSDFRTVTISQSTGCAAKTPTQQESRRSRSLYYEPCINPSTSANPATALFEGLRSWGVSFFSGDPNISQSGGKSYEFILTRADISFFDKNGKACNTFGKIAEVAVRFRGGKNDQYKEGTTRSIGRSGSVWLYPIHATWLLVQHHRELQLPDTDPLCAVTPGSIVQVRDIAQLIKTAAASARQQPQRFGTHSLRSGGASALFVAGVDSVAVKQFGRWRSDAFKRYVRLNSHQTSTMSSSILNPTSAAANYNRQPL